jgi:YWFCY protein/TraM recognition site of TraD and TraG
MNRQGIAWLSQAISILLLLLHFYYFDYVLFEGWGLTTPLGDHILEHIRDTGLFASPIRSKLFALIFLILSLLSSETRKSERIKVRPAVWLVLGAGVLYFIGNTIILTMAGFIGIFIGATRLARVLRLPWSKSDPFGRDQAGFPQEEQQRVTPFGLQLKAQYTYKGQRRESWINLINPRRGILIMGSPGSGKSWFIIEPLMRQLIQKGFALFIYDFKYDTLTRIAYQLFLTYRDRYPSGAVFYSINFTDLSRSHRCNVIDPATLEYLSDAIGASRTIMLSMNRTWIHRQGEFFVESPINFLAALIWYLRKYKDGIYCTLPHAIELAQVPYIELFPLLQKQPEIQTLISPFVEAFHNKTMEMLDSQISSAKIPLGRLASPDLYYILTGNDLSLDINDPAAPKILCLGGDPPRQEALAPVLSLYIDRLNKLANRPGKYPCALVCDEFATVRAYSMTTTIATARSNNIIPVLAVQDLSQLRTQYSREEADLILNITGNLLCGQVGGETARWVSERFPKILHDKTTVSTNSKDTSISQSQQWEHTVTPATVSTLSSGEFLGVVADDPGQELVLKAFHARLSREQEPQNIAPLALPIVRLVDAITVKENFERIKTEISNLRNNSCLDIALTASELQGQELRPQDL